ncbi:unnamed protein product [Lactuca virosa]|uniref:Uncharacterized protein n=1 Tax=Lactuca virosa TaxID=75947 RepID=A0AAU9LCY6_9ASTR|nr:unnamed protein product [Lactuca virosa]
MHWHSKFSTEEVEFSFNEFGPYDEADNYSRNTPDAFHEDYVGKLFDEMPGDEFWSELKAIRWYPASVDPPLTGLPWLVPDNTCDLNFIGVWNPWDKKAKAMPDFEDDEYKHILCVEAAAVEYPITLKLREKWKGRQQLLVVPSSYCSGKLDPHIVC